MKQKKLQTVAALIHGATLAKAGAIAHAPELGLVVGSAPLIEAALDPLLLAEKDHLNATGEWRTLATALREHVKTAYDLAYVVRDSLKPTYGRQYSSKWEGTGFERSLKIPRAMAPLQQLLRALKNHLATHPAAEISNVATAALVGTALDALITAQQAVVVQTGEVKTLLAARRKAEKVMRLRLSGTVEELKRVVGPTGGVWDAFGLNQPAIQQRPEKPAPVKAVLTENNDIAVDWERSPRANHYRVFLKVIGVDAEPIPVGSPADLRFMIESVPPASMVEVSLSAVNDGGESLRSDAVAVRTGGTE